MYVSKRFWLHTVYKWGDRHPHTVLGKTENGRKPEEENLASCLKITQTFMLIAKTLIHETAKLHLGNELLLSYYKNRGLILYTGLSIHWSVLLTSIQDYTKRLSWLLSVFDRTLVSDSFPALLHDRVLLSLSSTCTYKTCVCVCMCVCVHRPTHSHIQTHTGLFIFLKIAT